MTTGPRFSTSSDHMQQIGFLWCAASIHYLHTLEKTTTNEEISE